MGFVCLRAIKVWQKGTELTLSVNNEPFADFCCSTEKGNIFESFEKQILAIEMSLGLWNETRPSEIYAETTCSQIFSSDLLQESDLIGWIWELIVLPWKIPHWNKKWLGNYEKLWYFPRKWGHFLSPIPPTPNPMNLFAAPVLFEFFVREESEEGERRGVELLSCHVPLNILTFCSREKV